MQMKMKIPNKFTIKLSSVIGIGFFNGHDDDKMLIRVMIMPLLTITLIYYKPIIVM